MGDETGGQAAPDHAGGLPTQFAVPPPSFQPRRPAPRRASTLLVRAGTISSNDFKVGTTIELDNAPWRIVGMRRSEGGGGLARRFSLVPAPAQRC